MAHYSDDLVADSSVAVRHWILPALLLSLLFHGALYYASSKKTLRHFAVDDSPRLVPRSFNVSRVEVDQKLLKSEPTPGNSPAKPITKVDPLAKLTAESGDFQKDMQSVRAAPEPKMPEAPPIDEKPAVDARAVQMAAARAKAESAQELQNELNQVRQQLLTDKPDVAGRPKITTDSGDSNAAADNAKTASETSTIPAGFSNLDELLAGSGQVSGGTAPIFIPTDLLFDYNSAILRPGAAASLEKLGQLIRQNPQAVFRVEGHTDSFGGDAYNMDLSLRRAETVKSWLVQNMTLDPIRIQTQGFGKTHLLVPADRSVEEQQPNRRVEIVIHAAP